MPKSKSVKKLSPGALSRRIQEGKTRPIPMDDKGLKRAEQKRGSTHTQPTENAVGAPPQSVLPFPVVGIGASAGGLEALSQLLHRLPAVTGMSFVVVQHLDPSHESRLPEILTRVSQMPVREIKPGQSVEPDHVYVLPANAGVILEQGRFRLLPRAPRGVPMPVDIFFRSLAAQQQNRAIGIVLSGTGTDGTLGMVEIKGQGGLTFAQDKGTASSFGMPGSAIGSGATDFILSPEEIAQELMRLAHHPYVAERTGEAPMFPVPMEVGEPENLFKAYPDDLRTLFALLRTRRGVDFSLYKPGTLNRRIMRRMVLHKIEALDQYVKYLQENRDEVDSLFNDLLISVTAFFRDPSAFAVLQRRLLPQLLKRQGEDMPLRVWSCGCSTGEEAYSLAISIAEFLERAKQQRQVQVFASDLNESGIEKARTGIYHENILLDVSPERLRRYFNKSDGFYQVNKHIREMCVFARQNVVTDPPFSNLDLISCRNVLIYLTPILQKRVFPIFHYALKPGGYLFLGSSEGIGEYKHLFELVDKRHKIYVKKISGQSPEVDFESRHVSRVEIKSHQPIKHREAFSKEAPQVTLQQKLDRLILNEYSPAAVLVNAQLEVLQFRGKTGPYLEPQAGAASLNLLKLVREDLALDVRRVVSSALKAGEKVEQHGVEMQAGKRVRRVNIEAIPVNLPPNRECFLLVTFHETAVAGEPERPTGKPPSRVLHKKEESQRLRKLQEELAAMRDSLQGIIEVQEATNEELKSANEEIQSSNEELQSTNEELETAREELQSTNEELTTLNEELQNRNGELGLLNDDLTNLLSSVNIAIVMLGTDLRIRRFTPVAEKVFNLIPSDVGRRLSDLNPKLHIADLDKSLHNVIENLTIMEREVQDSDGHWYSLRIRPYRTRESKIEGVVLMLFDIDDLQRAMKQMISLVRMPVLALHRDLAIHKANEPFYRLFALQPGEAEDKSIYKIANGRFNTPRFKQLLEQILPVQGEVKDFRIEYRYGEGEVRAMAVNARRFYEESRGVQLILISFEPTNG